MRIFHQVAYLSSSCVSFVTHAGAGHGVQRAGQLRGPVPRAAQAGERGTRGAALFTTVPDRAPRLLMSGPKMLWNSNPRTRVRDRNSRSRIVRRELRALATAASALTSSPPLRSHHRLSPPRLQSPLSSRLRRSLAPVTRPHSRTHRRGPARRAARRAQDLQPRIRLARDERFGTCTASRVPRSFNHARAGRAGCSRGSAFKLS